MVPYLLLILPMSLLHGLVCLPLAYFIFSRKDLESIYSDLITMSAAIAAMVLGLSDFMLDAEVSSILGMSG